MALENKIIERDRAAFGPLTEVWPSVIFDIAVGRLVTNVEVDIQYIADTLSHAGMSDEAIAQTTLHFTDQTIINDKDNDELVKFGEHDPDTHTAFVYMGTVEHYVNGRGRFDDGSEETKEVLDWFASWNATEYALHELHHEVEEITIGKDALIAEELEYYEINTEPSRATRIVRWIMSRKFMAHPREQMQELLVDFEAMDNRRINTEYANAITSQDKYLNLPHEKRAREFSEGIARQITYGDKDYPIKVELIAP